MLLGCNERLLSEAERDRLSASLSLWLSYEWRGGCRSNASVVSSFCRFACLARQFPAPYSYRVMAKHSPKALQLVKRRVAIDAKSPSDLGHAQTLIVILYSYFSLLIDGTDYKNLATARSGSGRHVSHFSHRGGSWSGSDRAYHDYGMGVLASVCDTGRNRGRCARGGNPHSRSSFVVRNLSRRSCLVPFVDNISLAVRYDYYRGFFVTLSGNSGISLLKSCLLYTSDAADE